MLGKNHSGSCYNLAVLYKNGDNGVGKNQINLLYIYILLIVYYYTLIFSDVASIFREERFPI